MWRQDLRNVLLADPAGHLGQRYSAMANTITDDFPNPHVVNLYANPLTTSSNGGPDPPRLDSTKFDITKLVALCERYFLWDDVSHIMSNLREAVCLDMLRKVRDLQ